MNVVLVVLGQLVVLAMGAGVAACLLPRERGALAAALGYGYALGLVSITLILRLSSLAGIAWSFVLPAAVASLLAAALFAWQRRWWLAPLTLAAPATTSRARVLLGCLCALIAAHLALVGFEAVVRPVFPFDATAQWASKARAWYESGRIVPFVDDMAWVRATGLVYTDAHPDYPATVPLWQTWVALAWGSWDDAVANLSWPLLLAALAAAVYGQLRRLGCPPAWALSTAYAIVSIPFIDTHAALAGYADLGIAVFLALALLSLAAWLRTRRRGDAILTLLCACALPLLKAPGWAWLATLAAAPVFLALPARWFRALSIAAIALVSLALLYGVSYGPIVLLGYTVKLQYAPVLRSLFDNFFVYANWHLVALVVPLVLFANRGRLLGAALGPLTVTMAAGAIFLAVVFFFSSASEEGVEAYTTLNRAILHWIPALLAYTSLVLRDLWLRADRLQEGARETPAPPGTSPRAEGISPAPQ